MSVSSVRWRRAWCGAAMALLLLLSACGATSTGSAAPTVVAPPLDTVETLDDPRAYVGPSSVAIQDDGVRPITADPTPQLPVTLTDAQGTKVKVTDTSRVLALDLYGTLARTVYELGAGEVLVGRDATTTFGEAKDLPLVTTNGHDLDAEKILELNPTLLLTDTSLGPWDVVLQVRDAGIPVVIVEPTRTLDTIETITTQVAQALGIPEAGKQLNERTRAELEQVQAQIAQVAPESVTDQLRTVFIYARGGSGVYYMFGEGSGADSLIKALGLYDVAEEINWSGSKPLTDEGIISAQPDLLLMMTKGLESIGGVDGLLDRFPAFANTPAGQNRRIVDMDDSEILGYGPLTPQALNALAVAIYAPAAVSGE